MKRNVNFVHGFAGRIMFSAPRRKLGCPMTCRSRSSRTGVAIFLSVALLSPAVSAADLPPIKTSDSNKVATCATPGRLMAYVRERNSKLDARYESLAGEYARHGEALSVRWDYAFFQMLLETGYLRYGGDVRPEQNNFAGLGATGKGARGESFPDISTGARAHIEHLVMYSGQRVENPVAERTRNIQDWGVLTNWQKSLSGPITFSQLGKQWAPTSRRYVADIEVIANRFFDGICKDADPQPDVIAAAPPAHKTPGIEAKDRSIAQAKADGGAPRAALGAATGSDQLPVQGAAQVAAAASEAQSPPMQKASLTPPLKILNPAPPADVAAEKPDKKIEVAALPGGAMAGAGTADAAGKKDPGKSAPGSGKCRVWTASYGGSKAIIIKAVQDKTVNYTVLDVNDGAEKREADAYISAYAKGGESVGEFASQSQALEKAFELCPEG
jgi:hypothetical protein